MARGKIARAAALGAALVWSPMVTTPAVALTPMIADEALSPILFIAQQAQSGEVSVDDFMKAVLAEDLRMLQHGLTADEARAVRHLVDAFGSALPDYRHGLIITLGNVAAADARAPVLSEETRKGLGAAVLEAARYPDVWTRAAALGALANIEDPAVVPVLLAALPDENSEVRLQTLQALLAHINAANAAEIDRSVAVLTDDPDRLVAEMAAAIVRETGYVAE